MPPRIRVRINRFHDGEKGRSRMLQERFKGVSTAARRPKRKAWQSGVVQEIDSLFWTTQDYHRILPATVSYT